MIPFSAKEVHEHTARVPDGWQGDAPVFSLRVPTIRQRAAFRRDIAAAGTRIVTDEEMFRVLRESVQAAAPANVEQLVETIDRAEAMSQGKVDADEETQRELAAIEQTMRGFPFYAELVAARSFRFEITVLMAFRHFVCGWRGIEPAFRERHGVVPEDLVEGLPEEIVFDVGVAALGLLSPDGSQRKNSVSPRPSPSDPATSPTGSGHQTADAGASATTTSTSILH